MSIDENGKFITLEQDPENIDFYISNFCGFNDLLKALLRKDPETREAILGASYKDILCLRVQAYEVHRNLERIFDNKTLQADRYETASAAGEHPLTYGGD